MKKIIVLGALLFIINSSFAQNDKYSQDVLRRHAFYLNIGFLSLDMNYEHKLISFDKGYLFGRIGAGYWADWAILGAHTKFHLSYISGKKDSHLECNLGFQFKGEFSHFDFINPGEFINGKMLPIVNIGYRFQKPGRPFVFRVGIGTESIFYLSLGTAII